MPEKLKLPVGIEGFEDIRRKGFYYDIMIEPEDPDAGIIIEVKYAAEPSGLEKACRSAMQQIKARRYDARLRNEGRQNITAYGIAFNRKRCRVTSEKLLASDL